MCVLLRLTGRLAGKASARVGFGRAGCPGLARGTGAEGLEPLEPPIVSRRVLIESSRDWDWKKPGRQRATNTRSEAPEQRSGRTEGTDGRADKATHARARQQKKAEQQSATFAAQAGAESSAGQSSPSVLLRRARRVCLFLTRARRAMLTGALAGTGQEVHMGSNA